MKLVKNHIHYEVHTIGKHSNRWEKYAVPFNTLEFAECIAKELLSNTVAESRVLKVETRVTTTGVGWYK